jgi:hypothetical protein
MKSSEVVDLLRATFRLPEWAFFAEVRTRTGYSKTYGRDADSERYIDGFAMNMYPSKDFLRYAFEIKVSRGDWLREKDDFQKRAHAYYLSHRFYYVFGDEGIYRTKDDGYFLDGCGIYVIRNGQLVREKEATLRQPFPLPETFVASLMRQALRIAETTPPPAQPKLLPPDGGLFGSLAESITQN